MLSNSRPFSADIRGALSPLFETLDDPAKDYEAHDHISDAVSDHIETVSDSGTGSGICAATGNENPRPHRSTSERTKAGFSSA